MNKLKRTPNLVRECNQLARSGPGARFVINFRRVVTTRGKTAACRSMFISEVRVRFSRKELTPSLSLVLLA